MIRRSAGILIPLFSLRTGDDLGRGEIMQMKPMIDFAAAAGHRVIQLLPLNETAPDEASPYDALSVFSIDPLYISVAELPGVGRLAMRRARREVGAAARRISRGRYAAAKWELLERASIRFASRATGREKRAFEAFTAENESWLADYALFRALKDRFAFKSWETWPPGLARHQPRALSRARRALHQAVTKHGYLQFIAHRQWRAVRGHAGERKVLIGGDLAFSPSRDSAEVWAHQELFDLGRSVGAPPDEFNVQGQRWGLPMPNWERMRADGFGLWRARMRHAAALYDIIRVDHVVGLYRTYSFGQVPGEAGIFSPAREEDQRAQGESLIRALRAEAPEALIVAEDLGTVPPWVRESLKSLGVPGYKVVRWERENWHTPDERFISPAQYPPLSLATTGTHDTETLAAWWREQPIAERLKLVTALGLDGRVNPRTSLAPMGLNAVLEAVYRAPSILTVVPFQDLFGWGARINVPGTINDSNWTYRLPLALEHMAQSAAIKAQVRKLREIARASGRFDR